jgi:hypothetical protein
MSSQQDLKSVSLALTATHHQRSGRFTDADCGIPVAGVRQSGLYLCVAHRWPTVVVRSRTMELLASMGDIFLVSLLATLGWLMAALPATLVAVLIVACALFALLLDQAKRIIFPRFVL